MDTTLSRGTLWDVPELCARLNVSDQRGYKMIRDGTIPGVVRLGRQIRIDSRQVEAWIAAGGSPLANGWRR